MNYTIERTGDNTWSINGFDGLDLDGAVSACSAENERIGGDDFDMPCFADCRDALDDMMVGDVLSVPALWMEE